MLLFFVRRCGVRHCCRVCVKCSIRFGMSSHCRPYFLKVRQCLNCWPPLTRSWPPLTRSWPPLGGRWSVGLGLGGTRHAPRRQVGWVGDPVYGPALPLISACAAPGHAPRAVYIGLRCPPYIGLRCPLYWPALPPATHQRPLISGCAAPEHASTAPY